MCGGTCCSVTNWNDGKKIDHKCLSKLFGIHVFCFQTSKLVACWESKEMPQLVQANLLACLATLKMFQLCKACVWKHWACTCCWMCSLWRLPLPLWLPGDVQLVKAFCGTLNGRWCAACEGLLWHFECQVRCCFSQKKSMKCSKQVARQQRHEHTGQHLNTRHQTIDWLRRLALLCLQWSQACKELWKVWGMMRIWPSTSSWARCASCCLRMGSCLSNTWHPHAWQCTHRTEVGWCWMLLMCMRKGCWL